MVQLASLPFRQDLLDDAGGDPRNNDFTLPFLLDCKTQLRRRRSLQYFRVVLDRTAARSSHHLVSTFSTPVMFYIAFIKEFAPEMGRGFRVTYTFRFY
jgi:hypothetical protein